MNASRWLKLLSLLLVLIVVGCGTARQKSHKKTTAPKKPTGRAVLTAHKGELYLADPSGKSVWKAKYGLIEGDFLRGKGKIEKIQATMIENGQPTMMSQADEATYQPQNKKVVMQGNVKTTWLKQKAVLHAQQITMLLAEKLVVAQGNVTFDQQDEHLQGNKLRYDYGLKAFEITD